ncbi:hypothetical protein CS063_04535 [Sporanaerobium hydrogeniformans]|uniref:Uncharacterized protein n=1 Tax=Sporanaerobium hydrogeniformans TaxID=3072179 RepID=A0AC61DGB0_9FIRM|nr:hypothetical protein [Sporanaerobium hydrogeniformans]PHV71828.1 hypothetical protein CS063_04535 [Sporanaerobium hydrogeniformans]
MEKTIISQHLFIFPFTWKVVGKKKTALFIPQCQIKENLFDHLENWTPLYQRVESDKDYNEFVYYYKPIRAALYTFTHSPLIVRNYRYGYLEEDNYFIMQVEGKEYRLVLSSLQLKLYKTGIGLLTLETTNKCYEALEDMERINSFSKCIYPPLLPLEKAKEELFPDWIRIQLNKNHKLEECFKEDYHQKLVSITPLILGILGNSFIGSKQKSKKSKLFIEPILGNQMFSLCLYKNKEWVDKVRWQIGALKPLEAFLDNNKKHIKTLREKEKGSLGLNTYLQTENAIYGMSRFSLLCLVKEVPAMKLYDQLITLVVMQRATLLNLSTEISRVSTLPPEELVPAIKSLYEIYIQFINQLYFKEVTEDTEGAQIYDALSKQFKIEEELKQLDFEINEVHQYAMLVEQSGSRLKVELLTIVGAALVIPTFATGFFGMNIFKEEIAHWWHYRNVTLWLNSYVFLPILITITFCMWNRYKNRFQLLKKGLLILFLLISLICILKYGCGL